MPKVAAPLIAFNRGVISPLALARVDLERLALSAEIQTNWMPRTLGSMMLRPGLGYLGAVNDNAAAKLIPFVKRTSDTALVELTDEAMRVWVNDEVVTRPAVTAVITNGTFDTDLTGWTDADESGATSDWATGGYMGLTGTIYNRAIRRQTVTVNESDTVHALRIVIARGAVTLRIGSSSGADDVFGETVLRTGVHSIAFTPTTGSFVVELSARTQWAALVDSVAVEGSGALELPTPWGEESLPYVRWAQSGDVLFVAAHRLTTSSSSETSSVLSTVSAFSKAGSADDDAWSGYTLRQRIAASLLTGVTGTPQRIRVTLRAANAQGVTIDASSIGHAGGTHAWSSPALTDVTWDSGSGGASLAAGESKTSDWASFAWDGVTDIIITAHISGSSSADNFRRQAGTIGATLYHKAATSEADSADASSGYVTINSQVTGFLAVDVETLTTTTVSSSTSTGIQQRRIERRDDNSWSVVLYQPEDGPFRIPNLDNIRLTPSALTGLITLTASRALFRSGHAGALFKITSIGQQVEVDVTAEAQWSDPIRVTGVGSSRDISVTRAGTWSATVTLQRSVGEIGAWADVETYTTNATATYNDGLDNQVIFYRIGVDTGDYTSGTAELNLTYTSGGITGIVRILPGPSPTSAQAIVLKALGSTSASEDWSEGVWSDYRGWPSAVTIYEGRLWWAGNDRIIGSVSDAYESFDEEIEGDSGPINRTIGFGPVDVINWLLPAQYLLAGTEGSELSIRSTAFDEPLTPTAFQIKEIETQGSASVQAVKIGTRAMMVQRSGLRVYQLAYDGVSSDYGATDLTELVPEIGDPGIVGMAVQRQPDTRVHCWRSDGTAAVLVSQPAENVTCWIEVETDGSIEDAAVLPGTTEDAVYYVVKRIIGGATVRYLEKFALESECRGGALNKQADSFIVYSQSASSTITGLSHVEGESVVVWDNGICLADENGDIATFVVSGGSITVTNGGEAYEATQGVVGLFYSAPYYSTKLAYGAAGGTALTQPKRVNALGLILANTHAQGIQFGADADHLSKMHQVEGGKRVDQDSIWSHYDYRPSHIDDTWSTDSRVYLLAQAPRPCTVLGMVVEMETNG